MNKSIDADFEVANIDEKKLVKLMMKSKAIIVSGQNLIDQERIVLWKQHAFIGQDKDESVVEISKTKNKFYIVA